MGNQVLRKYRVLGKSKHFISLKMRKYGCDDLTRPHLSLVYLRKKGAAAAAKAKAVCDFLCDDSNSALSPGKKEFCFQRGGGGMI